MTPSRVNHQQDHDMHAPNTSKLHARALAAPGSRNTTEMGGFSLIELMVVVAIFGLLIAIALPSYTAYIAKAHRTDAKNALLDLANREERYYSVNNAYTANLTLLGYPASGLNSNGDLPITSASSSSSYYTMNVSVLPTTLASGVTVSTYTAVAAATGTQTSDACGSYQLDNTGKETVSTSAVNCW